METTLKTAYAADYGYKDAYVEDVFNGHGVEVTLPDADAFLKIKETLTRVGIQSRPGQLDQPCYILHKRGHYAIVHHLELRQLDGELVDLHELEDAMAVRNTITSLLEQWGLVDVADESAVQSPRVPVGRLKIVPHRAKGEWVLNPLYIIGKKR
jgi:hypothetical protein